MINTDSRALGEKAGKNPGDFSRTLNGLLKVKKG